MIKISKVGVINRVHSYLIQQREIYCIPASLLVQSLSWQRQKQVGLNQCRWGQFCNPCSRMGANGSFLAASSSFYGFCSYNMAEIRAILYVLLLWLKLQLYHVEFEFDSTVAVNWLPGKGCVHWPMLAFLEQTSCQKLIVQSRVIYGEIDWVADFLANLRACGSFQEFLVFI